MQKYLKMLEQNVQWIAVGLGAIYLLWMAYAYVLTPPVVVQLGNSPSDKKVTPDEVDTVIHEQAGKPLETAMSRTEPVEIKVADVLVPFSSKLEEKDIQVADLTAPFSGTRGSLLEDKGPELNGPGGKSIAQLPQVPKPQFKAESHDIATIALANPNAALPIPIINPNGPGGAQPLPPHKDTAWNSLKWKIPAEELKQAWAKAFNNPNVPGFMSLFQTKFLRVDVTREELLPDGTWGNSKQIEDCQPADMPPFPGSKLDLNDQGARQAAAVYKDWAGKFQGELVTPKFPPVLSVTYPWYPPGQQRPDVKAKRPGPGGNAVRPNAGPGNAAWANPPAAPAGAGPNAGEFDMSKVATDPEFLIHDTTVENGHKYRYRVQYELANPIFDSMNLTSRELASQFTIVSPPSDWSPEIEVPPLTQLFVTNVSSQTNKASLEVFEWKDAKWNKSSVTASPGDAVKDFTVVDIRRDASHNESYMLIMDRNGNIVRKDKNQDMHDPKYDELKNAIAADQPLGGPRMQASAR